jgi:hypothetical protein
MMIVSVVIGISVGVAEVITAVVGAVVGVNGSAVVVGCETGGGGGVMTSNEKLQASSNNTLLTIYISGSNHLGRFIAFSLYPEPGMQNPAYVVHEPLQDFQVRHDYKPLPAFSCLPKFPKANSTDCIYCVI